MHHSIRLADCAPQQPGRFVLRPLAYCVALACCELAAAAQPIGPTVVNGTAPMQGVGTRHLTITNSPGAIINWQGFSIAAGNTTQFVQQSASSAVLNRVVGDSSRGIRPETSSINGQLLSNGRVFLINPAGIVIGPTGSIDTAGFVGSTLNMHDADFLAGKLKFDGGAGAGSITNNGMITARHGGSVVLIAPQIENGETGTLETEGGQILLAAGRKLTIASPSLEGVQFEIQAPTDSVVNIGKMIADGGAIGAFAGTLKHSGDIRASALTRDEAGRVVLKAQGDVTLTAGSTTRVNGPSGGSVLVQSGAGTAYVHGTVEAKGTSGAGGTVHILGERVGVMDAATVDASGASGGGTILVGGDFQGTNARVQNAKATYFSVDASLKADAIAAGDGGKVIVWSDGPTRAHGAISARGGAAAGNGGFVETSGHYLEVEKTPDLTAPAGQGGTWLIDPLDITISVNAANNNISGASPFQPTANNTTTNLSVGRIQSAMNGAQNIVIQTGAATGPENGDIIFDASAGAGGPITLTRIAITGDGTLTLNAAGDIRFVGGPTTFATSAAQALTVVLNASGGISTAAGASTRLDSAGAGAVTMQVPAGRTWQNNGTIDLLNDTTAISLLGAGAGAARLQNNAGGVINFGAGGIPITSAANAGVFTNAGRVEVNTSGTWQAAFTNELGGVLNVRNANTTLFLPNAQTIRGTVLLDDPLARLMITDGTAGVFDGTAVNGTGVLTVDANGTLATPLASFTGVTAANTTTLRAGSRASLVITGDSTFGNVEATGGGGYTGNANVAFNINGNLTIAVGGSTFNGTTTVGGVTTLGNAFIDGAGAFSGGTLNWTDGNIIGTGPKTFTNITTTGTPGLFGNLVLNGGTWNNNGTLTQQDAGRITLMGGATINNNATRNWTIAATSTDLTPIAQSGTGGTFDNFGTFTNDANPGAPRTLGPVFNNRAGGTVNVNDGILTVGQTPTPDQGTYNVTNPGVLAFGGTRTLGGTSNVAGTGEARFTVGTVTVNGAYGIAATGTTTIAGGAAVFDTGVAGGLNFANPFTLSSGSLSGGDIITLSEPFTWSGGTVTGGAFNQLNTTGVVNIANPVTLNTRAWNNTGTVNQTLAGRLTLVGSPTVTNARGGIWQLATTETNPITGPGIFNNAGTFTNNGPTAATIHTLTPTTFENTGAVNVTIGTLIINASGIHTGVFDTAANTLLEFTGANTNTFRPAAALQGLGTIRFSGGNNTVEGAIDDLAALEVAGAFVGIQTGAVFNNVGTTTASSGSLSLATAAATDALTVSGATVSVGAALTVNGPVNVSSGTLTVNADSTVAGALTLSGGTLDGGSMLTINGTGSQWTGGTMSGVGTTVFSGANTLAITGTGTKAFTQRTLTTGTGVTTWDGGTVQAGNGGTFNVNGIFDIAGTTDKTWANVFGGAPTTITIANPATVRHSGTGTDSLAMAIVGGGGAIDVQAGTLRLSTGLGTGFTGTLAGALTASAAGATLDFAGGNYIVPGTIDGPGSLAISGGAFLSTGGVTGLNALNVSSGTATFNATAPASTLTADSVVVSGGTLQVTRPLTVTGAFTLNNAGATARLNGATSIGGLFDFSGGTLTGAGPVDLNGGGTWSAGTLDGTGTTSIPNGATLNISGPGLKTLDNGRVLSIGGIAGWSGTGNIDVRNGSQIATVAGGVFEAQNDQSMLRSAGAGTFNNAGTFQKTAGAATTSIAPVFNNNNGGTVKVNSGTLRLTGGGTHTGAFEVNADTLEFGGGPHALNLGSSFTGAGTVRVGAGQVDVNTPLVIANPFVLTGGNGVTLGGTGNLELSGAFTWSQGADIRGAGLLTTSGVTTISGAPNGIDKNWRNTGTVTVDATGALDFFVGASTLTNDGTFILASTVANPFSVFSGSGAIVNNGIFDKTGAGVQTILDTSFANTATGTLNVSAGTLVIPALSPNAGAIELSNGATLSTNGAALANQGTIGGVGTIDVGGATLTNNAIMRPGAAAGDTTGTLAVTGNFTQGAGAGARLDVELGGPAAGDFDLLNVSGNANLAGTLNVSRTGGYLTAAGDNFNVVTAGAVTGFFGTVAQQNFGRDMATAYLPDSVQLTMGTFVVNSWSVNADGNWNNPGNWIEGHVPLADERVVIDQPGNLTITLPAGSFSIDRLTSNESIAVAGGNLVLANASTITGALAMSAGSIGGAGPLTVTGPFALNGGTIASTGGVLVNGTTTIAAGAPQLTGVLSTNVLDMTGGTLGVAGGGILTLAGPGTSRIANATLNNSGTVRYATPGDDLLIDNGAVFNNQVGGVLDIQGDIFARGAGTGMFNNAGTVLKSGGTVDGPGGFDTTLPFNNNGGLLDSQLGALELRGGGTHTGQFRTAGNGVNLNGGTHTFAAGSSIDGPFVFLNNGATMDVSGNPTINSSLVWNGPSTITGGTLTVAPGAVLNIVGLGDRTLDGVTVNNDGTTIHGAIAGDLLINGGSVFNNRAGAIFDFNGDTMARVTAGAGTFDNAGTLTKSAGTGTGGFTGAGFGLSNTGTIHVAAGTLQASGFPVNDGALTIDAGAVFSTNGNALAHAGVLRGNGTLDLGGATLTSSGIVAPGASPGMLVIDGNYVQTPTGTLAIDLGGTNPGVSYDRLQVNGNALLDGTLAVTYVNGFAPAAGERFDFLTYTSRTGDFANFNFPPGSGILPVPGATVYAVGMPVMSLAGMPRLAEVEDPSLNDQLVERGPDNAERMERPRLSARQCE